MRFMKTALVGVAGVLGGLVLGYALWGHQVEELSWTLGKTNGELWKTQAWLRDEIRTSDERHEHVSATLTKALADLARTRAQLARMSALSKQSAAPSASPGQAAGANAGNQASAATESPAGVLGQR